MRHTLVVVRMLDTTLLGAASQTVVYEIALTLRFAIPTPWLASSAVRFGPATGRS
jgi:hypothetical protein